MQTDTLFHDGADVGDVLYSSWGYDQTNVDFYKVVRRTASSVWLVRIGARHVPGSEGFMSERTVPDPDVVIPWGDYEPAWKSQPGGGTEPRVKRIRRGYGGGVAVTMTSYAGAYPYEHGERGAYRSWYA